MEERELAEKIFNGGEGLVFKNHYETIKIDFLAKLTKNEKEVENFLKRDHGNHERIRFLKKFFTWTQPDLNHGIEKSEGISIGLRELGKSECSKGNYSGGLRAFNLSIGFGRCGSQELALAHFNRSAILFAIGEKTLALKDLQLASLPTFPINLKPKLEERREKWRENENQRKEPNGQNHSEKSKEKRKELTQKFNSLFQVEGSNEKLPAASHFVRLEKDEKKGRKLIVSTHVPPGTTLVSEKPFVKALEKELCWEDEHCHWCFKRTLAPIPCNTCTFGYFCNEKCRENGRSSFHGYEHELFPFLVESSTSQKELVALRMITTLGPTALTQLYKNHKTLFDLKIRNSSTEFLGMNAKENIDIEDKFKSFLSLFHLISHSQDSIDLQPSLRAIYLTHLLFNISNFSSKFRPKIHDALLEFTAALILRHLEIIPFNLMSLNELRNCSSNSYTSLSSGSSLSSNLALKVDLEAGDLKSIAFGTALFETLSFCNHSCSPNTIHIKGGFGGQTSLINVSPLVPGEEICINYGPIYTKDSLAERRGILKTKYWFHCECAACEGNWTTPSDFDPKMRRSVRGFEKFEKSLQEAFELVKKNEAMEGWNKIIPPLVFFHSFKQPFFLSQVAMDLLKRVIIKILYHD